MLTVLFDGYCSLCDASVRFIIDNDPHIRLRLASLQSPEGTRLLAERGYDTAQHPSSVLLVTDDAILDRSTAALTIARYLRPPWNLFSVALLLPRPVRDALYGIIARNRYRWFGKRDSCRIPTPADEAHFL